MKSDKAILDSVERIGGISREYVSMVTNIGTDAYSDRTLRQLFSEVEKLRELYEGQFEVEAPTPVVIRHRAR